MREGKKRVMEAVKDDSPDLPVCGRLNGSKYDRGSRYCKAAGRLVACQDCNEPTQR
jgi:hypothetical protein